MLSKSRVLSVAYVSAALLVAVGVWWATSRPQSVSGERILTLIERQVELGPRYLTAPGHAQVQEFMKTELKTFAPDVRLQRWQHSAKDGKSYTLTNVIGRLYPERTQRIVLGAHYDTKRFADQDKQNSDQPVSGANDGASGVALLLETARVLMANDAFGNKQTGIDIVFFDGEEGEEGQLDDYDDWRPLGSAYFSQHLPELYGNTKPVSGVVLDMVCERGLQLRPEAGSLKAAPSATQTFWDIGRKNYPKVFSSKIRSTINDDHTALNNAGIPTFLVIDYEYPAYHTTEDTPDKCSPESLKATGQTLYDYLLTVQ